MNPRIEIDDDEEELESSDILVLIIRLPTFTAMIFASRPSLHS
jgi:hypothetical protein